MAKKPPRRFGIGEWYGRLLTGLSVEERQQLAQAAQKPPNHHQQCPFRKDGKDKHCRKAGGVCTLRLYEQSGNHGTPAADDPSLRTTCPYRFHEDNKIIAWVGREILGYEDPYVVKEIPFLHKQVQSPKGKRTGREAGRIDMVLVHPDLAPSLSWCAVEIQAVYFSGRAMVKEFENVLASQAIEPPFPAVHRRPDYRSSGVKRLMPQLQTKVPTLRRWGKKLAIVVDQSFYDDLGKMEEKDDISNADIAWFVTRYEITSPLKATLELDSVRYTTLEDAVQGLTGATPLKKEDFEKYIKGKLRRQLGLNVPE